MKRSEEILEYLRREGQKAPVPEGIEPKQIRKRLEAYEADKEREEGARETAARGNTGTQKEEAGLENRRVRQREPEGHEAGEGRFVKWKKYYKPLIAVACICLSLRVAAVWQQGFFQNIRLGGQDSFKADEEARDMDASAEGSLSETEEEASRELLDENPGWRDGFSGEESLFPVRTSYEEVYASMSGVWERELSGTSYGNSAMRDAADDALPGKTMKQEMAAVEDLAGETPVFGTTNVQTEGVDEGDLLKNDGRYLYQAIRSAKPGESGQEIQILDTRDGLEELGRLGGFEQIDDFYVWQDLLIVIENKYADYFRGVGKYQDVARMEGTVDYRIENGYHEISFYRITDRANPRKIKTFTLQGNYLSSRIAEGYFYGFSRYYAAPGNGEADYDAYVPNLDGKRLMPEEICLSQDSGGTSYLVLVSIDLADPSSFFQTLGVIAGGDLFYVSQNNIYVTDYHSPYGRQEEGTNSDSTSILRFSYDKGKFYLRARGEVPGRLNDSFSLDEYNGYLRIVSTVREYQQKKVVDERTGETVGYDIREGKRTNGLYVLDEKLSVTGKIEGLAQDEEIYSARFLKNTGYFVTFRQTDPLFAVDLSKPEAPSLLGELKITGFSEYLHFYGTDRLLGIGMETDETGRQLGMKLTMFDISDPGDVKEASYCDLTDYDYSPALYDHRAVLIDTKENLFGFEAAGSEGGRYGNYYLLFSYEKDAFVRKFTLDTKNKEGDYASARGTFIGDVFYLLLEDGTVRSYNRHTGAFLEGLGE